MTAKEAEPTGDPTEEDFIIFAIAMINGRATGTSNFHEIVRAVDGNWPRDIEPTPSILLAYCFFQATNRWLALLATIKSSKHVTQNVQRAVVEATTAPSCGVISGGLTSGRGSSAISLRSPDTVEPADVGLVIGDTTSSSPHRPVRPKNKSPAGSKSTAAANGIHKALENGARSIEGLVEVGRNRLKIAEDSLDVATFADSSTPEHERAAFDAKKRAEVWAKRAAEYFSGQSVSQKQQAQQALQLHNTYSVQRQQVRQPAFDDDSEEAADECH
jgi:hypothetical protein